jgi:DNA invertase Pin-like site-specific DNA recombinase
LLAKAHAALPQGGALIGANGREKRPAFDRMLKAATRREFDLIAAWSVDRLVRSLQNLVSFLNKIHGKRIDLHLHQQGIDTATPSGQGAVSDVRSVRGVRAGNDC